MSLSLFDQTVSALNTLYFGDNAQLMRQANEWLQVFQQTDEAWTVSDQLMRSNIRTEFQYFGSQTMHSLIVNRLENLNESQILNLRASLIRILYDFRNGPQIVATQVCLSVASLAVQFAMWENPVQDMIVNFGPNSETQNSTLSILLEFLTVLPDECDSGRIRVSAERKRFFRKLLRDMSTEIIALLQSFIAHSGGDKLIHIRVFKCALSWLRCDAVNLQIIYSSRFLQLFFESLKDEELFELSSDSLCEIIRISSELCEERDQPNFNEIYGIITCIVQEIRNTRPIYQLSIQSQDLDVAKGLTRIYIEAGESYLNELFENFSVFGDLVALILESSANPNLDIAQLTFNFWYNLQHELMMQQNRQFLPNFVEFYRHLVGVIVRHLIYPLRNQDWTAEQRDEFKNFRHIVGDTLKDCCAVVGGENCLTQVHGYLVAVLNKPDCTWQEVEAGLFAIRCMASEFEDRPNTILHQIIPTIMSTGFPTNSKIRYTVTLIIGRYSFWSASNPQYLESQIAYIRQGFADAEVSPASSLAFKYLAKSCATYLVNYISQMMELYNEVVDGLRIEDQLEMTEALLSVVSAIPVSNISPHLNLILQKLMFELVRSMNESNNDQVCLYLERVSTVIEFCNPVLEKDKHHPLMEFLPNMWQIFQRVVEVMGSNEDVIEKLGRCFRQSIRTCKKDFAPLVSVLGQLIISGFKRSPFSSYVYAAKELVQEFGDNEKNVLIMRDIMNSISHITFELLKNFENFMHRHDLVEDYFKLMYTFLKSCPLELASMIDSLVACSSAGLVCNHRESVDAIFEFLYKLLALSWKERKDQLLRLTTESLRKHGQSILNCTFSGIAGPYPKYLVENCSDTIRFTMLILPEEASGWISSCFNSLGNFLTATEREDFQKRLWETVKSGSEFEKHIKDLSSLIKKRK